MLNDSRVPLAEKDKELCSFVQSQTKTNEPVVSVPIVKKKKVKKQSTEATEPKTKPKFTYLPSTDDKDYADLEDQDTQQDICPELKAYLNNLQRDKPDKKTPWFLSSKKV